MQRYSSAYLSSRPFGRRPQLFRTAKLNAAGWAAVVGLGAAGAAAGLAAARLTNAAPSIATPAGAMLALAGLIAADRRKWAATPTGYSWTDDLNQVQQIADLLTRAGVAVSVEVNELDRPRLHYLNRDHRQVRRIFRSAGLLPPRKH